MTPAQRWGTALDAAIRRRDVSQAAIARVADVSAMSVARWRRGQVLPSYDLAIAMSVALDDESLAGLMRELRTRTCQACGHDFIVTQNPDARWCPREACRNVRYKDGRKLSAEKRQRRRTRRLGRTLANTYRVIAETCAHMCGGPFCPDATCPPQVKGLSPYPVALRDEQLMAVPKGENRSAAARRREAAKRAVA